MTILIGTERTDPIGLNRYIYIYIYIICALYAFREINICLARVNVTEARVISQLRSPVRGKRCGSSVKMRTLM